MIHTDGKTSSCSMLQIILFDSGQLKTKPIQHTQHTQNAENSMQLTGRSKSLIYCTQDSQKSSFNIHA